MATGLLDIEPREIKFIVEPKKLSECSIQLRNKSDEYVAFKIKTTSPKRYCVRPNIGVLKPGENCDFTVTMQALRTAPSDLQCKDKFLVQSTVVSTGTTEENLTSDTFARNSNKHIEDKKLRVVLVNAASSSPVLHPVNGGLKQDPNNEISAQKDTLLSGVENIPPPPKVMEDVKGLETVHNIDESGTPKDMDKPRPTKDLVGLENVKGMDDESNVAKDMERSENAMGMDAFRSIENIFEKMPKNIAELRAKNAISRTFEFMEKIKPGMNIDKLRLSHDLGVLKSKHLVMDTKLREQAELTLKKLMEERSMVTREKDKLKHEIEILRKGNVRRIQVGFPFLYVCMVALVSMAFGYLVHF